MDEEDAGALSRVDEAFRDCPRPDHFTEWQHCCECAEHDAVLAEHTPGTIGLGELGNAGWDPICFATQEAYAYYLPGLARLALGRGSEYYLEQFLFHLNAERVQHLTQSQRVAVAGFLEHLAATRLDEPDFRFDLPALREARELLSVRLG